MIHLELELKEVEQVLQHLAKGVFAEVAGVFEKIRTQALPQAQEQALAEQKDSEQNTPTIVVPPTAIEKTND
jgi:hypothetical protein